MLSAQGGHYYTTLAIIDGFKSLSSRKELESTVDGDQANSEDQRINTDFRDNFGLSAILLAANNGHSDLVKLLLEKTSSNVNDRIPSSGMTALMVTSQKGLLSTAKILLEKGADPNLQSTTGESALLYASVGKFLISPSPPLSPYGSFTCLPTYLPTCLPAYLADSYMSFQHKKLLMLFKLLNNYSWI